MAAKTTQPETPIRIECGRCLGAGVVSYGNVTFAVRRAGVVITERTCFECSGAGHRDSTVEREARLEKRREADRKRREAKAEALRQANVEAFAAAFPEAWAAVEALVAAEVDFGYTVRAKVWQYGTEVHEGTREAAVRVLAEEETRKVAQAQREAEEEARKEIEVPAGRQVVTGEVVNVRVQDGYMPGSTTVKMLVQDDRGFRVFGTMPAALLGTGVERGTRVTFTATLEPKEGGFGFYSRATKASQA